MWDKRWRHFKFEEFACHCGCGRNEMQFDVIDLLDNLREELGKPIIVSSGYRCPEYNAKVSTTGITGPHTTGRAVDIKIYGYRGYKLVKLALELGFTGIGLKQKGPWNERFIHLDDLDSSQAFEGPRPWIWTY